MICFINICKRNVRETNFKIFIFTLMFIIKISETEEFVKGFSIFCSFPICFYTMLFLNEKAVEMPLNILSGVVTIVPTGSLIFAPILIMHAYISLLYS